MAGLDNSALMTAATGIKWNVTDTVVLSGQILWALNDAWPDAPRRRRWSAARVFAALSLSLAEPCD